MEVVNFQERIASGDIPEDVAEITAGCRRLLRVNSRVSQTIAVCIAAVHTPKKVDWWVKWCRDEFGLESCCYRSHLAQAGRVLLSLTREECNLPYYVRLFECDIEKIRELAPLLPGGKLVAFLSRHAIGGMTREAVRAAVAAYNNHDNTPKTSIAKQPELPGFDEMLSGALSWNSDDLANEVHSSDDAERSLTAGMMFLGAGIEYEKRSETPDVVKLTGIKQLLLREVAEIEEAISKAL
jgi:hypothetical protein